MTIDGNQADSYLVRIHVCQLLDDFQLFEFCDVLSLYIATQASANSISKCIAKTHQYECLPVARWVLPCAALVWLGSMSHSGHKVQPLILWVAMTYVASNAPCYIMLQEKLTHVKPEGCRPTSDSKVS